MYSSHYLQKGNKVFPYSLLFGSLCCLVLTTLLVYKTIGRKTDVYETNIQNSGILTVSNVSSNSASIIWETNDLEYASLTLYQQDRKIGTYIDDRDVEEFKSKRKYHYVTVRGLTSHTSYRAYVNMNQKEKKVIEFQTRPTSDTIEKQFYSYGKISKKNENERFIVILEFEGYFPISTITSLSKEWLLSMHLLTPNNFNTNIQTKKENGLFHILSETQNKETQVINYKTFVRKYALVNNKEPYGNVAGVKTDQLKMATSKKKTVPDDISIIMPEENAFLNGSKPIFKGLARPKQKLKVMIKPGEGNVYQMRADNEGNWVYVPYFSLENGKYEFTISSQDGLPVTKFRTFTILKSGESVLGEATGEARLTPTVTPTTVIQPTSTIEPTPTVIAQISPTITQISPTQAQITPTTIVQVTPTSVSEPVSGLDIRLFSIASITFIIFGTMLFIFL